MKIRVKVNDSMYIFCRDDQVDDEKITEKILLTEMLEQVLSTAHKCRVTINSIRCWGSIVSVYYVADRYVYSVHIENNNKMYKFAVYDYVVEFECLVKQPDAAINLVF